VARNDQVTRQWHLLRRLEGPRGATLQELGSSLPADLPRHLRTVRRDLDALESAGRPDTDEVVLHVHDEQGGAGEPVQCHGHGPRRA
jgi:hypothetical protein